MEVRGAWAYSDLMPVVRVFGFEVGLSPLAQWVVVPLAASGVARARTLSGAAGDHSIPTHRGEPPRLCRRLFGLGHIAKAGSSARA